MSRLHIHPESHLVSRIGWLRAAVLGASDGIVSTASLIVGVAAASAATSEVLVAAVACLVAGAILMAAGEYVSVSSQSDTEQADFARERAELATQPEFERKELARIYIDRGVSPDLAYQWMAKDALGAHVRDELGISEVTAARPIQAALTSAATFAVGAGMPLAMVLLMPRSMLVVGVSVASLLLPFPPWCRGRAGGWCQCDESHPAGDLLGRARDGADGRDRRGVRNGCRVMWMVLHIPQSTRGAPDDHCRA
ncbi:VIT1/CCC1 transporter family protein [Cypionkella psychrotolerans]